MVSGDDRGRRAGPVDGSTLKKLRGMLWTLIRPLVGHIERHWVRLATTNCIIVTASMMTNIESLLKITVLFLTAVLTVLGIYYKIKKNGADKP